MSSGFNLLSLKKEVAEDFKTLYHRHVVVGEDLFTVALLLKLVEKFGKENVLWICPREIQMLDLLPLGPTLLRGRANIEKFQTLFPDVSLKHHDKPAEFFKELKWREFGGRAKSEKLLWNEEFFTQERADFDIADLYPFLRDENLLSRLEELRYNVEVKDVEKTTPTDLAEPNNFELILTDNDHVRCEHLYWGGGAERLLSKYDKKGQLTDEFITFCESTHAPSALYLRFVFDKPVTDKEATLFIPLSYTHEWGHFVGEFKECVEGKQIGNFVTFMDIESTNEDEISKKIRLLKKNLEKIFGDSGKEITEEFIKLTSTSACLKIDDSLYKTVEKDWSNLKMVSFNAPLDSLLQDQASFEDSANLVSTVVRGALRNQEILSSLH
ncbi:MAG: hypothetical protein NXH75_17115 [Halobacteriovoraceae bacterium]|nr:hypothetical protein [Halobacteriovoraceae bacterium]